MKNATSRADIFITSEHCQRAFARGVFAILRRPHSFIMSGKRSASDAAADEPDSKVAKVEPIDGAGPATEDGAAAENPAPAEEENKKEVQEGGADGGDRAEGDDQGEGEDADAAVRSRLDARTRTSSL